MLLVTSVMISEVSDMILDMSDMILDVQFPTGRGTCVVGSLSSLALHTFVYAMGCL